MDCDVPTQHHETPKYVFPATTKLSHTLYEEVLHSRFHRPLELLARMNGKVRGLPRPIRVAFATKIQCAH
eukprot:1519131-Rhodomonas_salina.1